MSNVVKTPEFGWVEGTFHACAGDVSATVQPDGFAVVG